MASAFGGDNSPPLQTFQALGPRFLAGLLSNRGGRWDFIVKRAEGQPRYFTPRMNSDAWSASVLFPSF